MPHAEPPELIAADPQVYVEDVVTSAGFYVDKLGFDLIFAHGEPPFYGQVGRGGARLNLRCVHGPVFVSDFRARNDDPLAALVTVNGIEELFGEYEAAGVELHQRLRREFWGSRTFIVKDPDDNLICFAGD